VFGKLPDQLASIRKEDPLPARQGKVIPPRRAFRARGRIVATGAPAGGVLQRVLHRRRPGPAAPMLARRPQRLY
jgi:hypothetical protein